MRSPARGRQTVRLPEGSHRILLVREDAQGRAGEGAAQQDEARFLVLRIETARFRLIDLALEQPAGAGRTPALQAREREVQTGRGRDVEQILGAGCLRLDLVA